MGAPKLPAGRYSTSQAAAMLGCTRLRLIAALDAGLFLDGQGEAVNPERDDHNRRLLTLDDVREIAISDFNASRSNMEQLRSAIRNIIIERRKIDAGDG